jgi:hypothetical protein
MTNTHEIKSMAENLIHNRIKIEASQIQNPQIQKFYHYYDTYKNTFFLNKLKNK